MKMKVKGISRFHTFRQIKLSSIGLQMYEIAWGMIFHEKGDDLSRICQGIRCRNLIMAKKNIFGENLYHQGGKN